MHPKNACCLHSVSDICAGLNGGAGPTQQQAAKPVHEWPYSFQKPCHAALPHAEIPVPSWRKQQTKDFGAK